jgi:hypothetical protein
LEWIDYQSSLCSGCGQPKTECMDPENDGHYVADPVQCFACAARDAESRGAAKAKSDGSFGDAAFDGIYFAVREREAVTDG